MNDALACGRVQLRISRAVGAFSLSLTGALAVLALDIERISFVELGLQTAAGESLILGYAPFVVVCNRDHIRIVEVNFVLLQVQEQYVPGNNTR